MDHLLIKRSLCDKPYILPHVDHFKYKLDMNEGAFSHCQAIQTCNQTSRIDLQQYPTHDKQYYDILDGIADHTHTHRDNVLLTCGSDGALKLISSVILRECKNILILTPTYPQFILTVKYFTDCQIDFLQIDYSMNNQTVFELLHNKLNSTHYDACYIVNPNMPLGYSFSFENTDQLLFSFNNTIFIIDQAYIEYCNFSPCDKLIYTYPNLFITRTFSKFFMMANARVGYVVSSHENINLLAAGNSSKDIPQYSLNLVSCILQNKYYYYNLLADVNTCKQYIVSRLAELKNSTDIIYDYVVRDGGYFLIISHHVQKIINHLVSHDIYVRDKSADITDAIRISIGPIDVMRDVIDAIASVDIS